MTAPVQTPLGPSSAEGLEPPPNAVRCSIPIMFLEGLKTGDGRYFNPDAGGHRELPLSLFGLTYTSAGGHEGAEVVGRIDTMTRTNGAEVTNPDTGEPFGSDVWVWGSNTVWLDTTTKTYELVHARYLRGVSVDLAEIEVEFEWTQPDDDGFVDIDQVTFTAWRIAGATVCPIPAFAATRIELPDDAPVPAGNVDTLGAAITASAAPWPMGRTAALDDVCPPCLTAAAQMPAWTPPAEWFADPQFSEYTPLTITTDGRIMGHLAPWGACHIGMPGCVTPPRSGDDYAHFLVGETVLADGSRVATGNLTVTGGHAKVALTAEQAAAHYDNVATALGPVRVGEDAHGIWMAGAVYPDTDPALVARARAGGVSGDWRAVGSRLELISVHCVNVPGFRAGRAAARLSDSGPVALVASFTPPTNTTAEPTSTAPEDVAARLARLERLAARPVTDTLARLAGR